jgi:hypothetical protein
MYMYSLYMYIHLEVCEYPLYTCLYVRIDVYIKIHVLVYKIVGVCICAYTHHCVCVYVLIYASLFGDLYLLRRA